MTEPTITALGGSSPLRIARRYFLATRPKFFTASVLPVLLGSAWGYFEAGAFNASAFALGAAATVLVHAGANVLNDVFDELSGNDRLNRERMYPYSGGSRFIQNGVISLPQMARWGTVLLVAGIACGLALATLLGIEIILFGLVGVALGVLYSAPPVRLSGRGLGEVAVGIAFGVLPVMGAAWLQTGYLSLSAFWISLPVSLWVTAILLINEVPDTAADAAVGRRTLAVRLTPVGTELAYLGLQVAAALVIIGVAAIGELPGWGATAPVLMLVGAWVAGGGIADPGEDRGKLRKAIELTLGLHALGCMWLIVLVTGRGLLW